MAIDPNTQAQPPGGLENSQTDPNLREPIATAPEPVAAEGKPALADLQNQLCPNCKTGVLYVRRYDPDALHEAGQDLTATNQNPSGGGYEVHCLSCDFSESRPFGVGDTEKTA